MTTRTITAMAAGLFLLSTLDSPAQEGLLYHADSVEGIRISTGPAELQPVLEVNRDPRYISEGTGSIRLAGVKPADSAANKSAYVAMDIPLAGVSWEGMALTFDAWSSQPEATKGFYVRGLDEQRQHVASWSSWNADRLWDRGKVSFELIPGLSSDLNWEAAAVKSDDRSKVMALRIFIGTREPGAAFEVFIDNIRLERSSVRLFSEIDQAAPLYPDTWLAQAGIAQAIVVTPDEVEWQTLGADVVRAITDVAGVTLEVKTVGELSDNDVHDTNAIVLGSVVNNRRLLYSYSHRQVFADDFYPGPGGYDLRSVHDPWGTGKNMLSIGASDLEGARAGIAALKAKLGELNGPNLRIPRLLEVHLTGEARARLGRHFDQEPGEAYFEQQKSTAESGLERGVHTGLFGQARNVGLLYALTRKPAYAQAFVWLIRRAKIHHDSKPTTYGGPWGMDSDFAIFGVMPAWNEIEMDPSLTDRERLETARILFEWVDAVASRKGRARGRRVRFNHQTFPALGLAYAGDYFLKRYGAVEARDWLASAEQTFGLQIETNKPHCDCNSYQWLTLYHTVLYSLATQNLTYFENGNARLNVDYAIHTMNNLGYQVAYGDIGGWGPTGGNEVNIMNAAEWYFRDGRARWAIDKKMAVRNTAAQTQFINRRAAPVRPDDLLGAHAWPVPELWYESFLTESGIALEQTVDKIIFRNGFEPEDQYLLLDGLSVGGHGHMDGNSIVAWTQNNRIWLTDGDYIKALPKFHNGVLILRDGQSAKIPPAVELVSFTDLPGVAVSRTAKRDYAGADWVRNIVWIKGQAFLVLDRMEARTDGDFSFRAVWQTVGEVDRQGAVLDIDQKGQRARIAMSDDTRTMLHDDPALGRNWASYPHARDPIIRVFQGIVAQTMTQGDTADLFTVLHASGETPSAARLKCVAPNAAVFTGEGEPVLLVAPSPSRTSVLPGLIEGEAELFVLSPSRLVAVGATRLAVGGSAETFAEPTDLEIDLRRGLRTRRPTRRSVHTAPEPATSDSVSAHIDAAVLSAAIDALLERAAPPARVAAADPSAPAITPLWQYAALPSRFLLTNNAGTFGGIDVGMQAACVPEPLATNVFSGQQGVNTLDRAFDGQEQGTGAAVMWDEDQEVSITLEFDNVCRVDDILLKAWFATASSKNKLFQLGRLRVLASNDGFVTDTREVLDHTDTAMHPSWGAPIRYAFEGLNFEAQHLRLILTPRPGSGIYIAELELWGTPAGVSLDTAAPDILDAFLCVDTADIDGDGHDTVAAGAESGHVYCLNSDGSLRWRFNTYAAVRDLAWIDFMGDGKRWVVAGGPGGKVFAIDDAGNERWTYQIPAYKRTGHIRVIFPADLTGDGRQIAMVGAENWRYYALDAEGAKLWHYESVHPSTAGTAVDLDGDGKQELALGTAYYWWHMVNADGSRRWGYRTRGGPGVTTVAAGDITGNGTPEVLFGGEDTFVQVADAEGKPLWQFNTGDEVTGLATARFNGRGPSQVFVSSLSFNVYCLDGEGQVLWRTDLGAPVRAMAVHDRGKRLAVACDDGSFTLLDPERQGKIVGRFDSGGRIPRIAPAQWQGKAVFVAAGENGYLRAFPIE